MGEIILEMKNICKEFPGVKALSGVDFTVRRGEVHALIGENGAGKSTLMKVLTGIYRAESGTVHFKGKEFQARNPRDAQEQGISIIHQELNLLPDLNVAENIFITREPTKAAGCMVDDKKMHQRAKELMQKLSIDIRTTEIVGNLSVAQKQMVEIAKALAVDSDILVLDEPTSALAENEVNTLFDIIRSLRNEGKGIVYISHRLEEFERIVDRVTVLRDGTYVDSMLWKDTDIDGVVTLMVGRSITEQYPKRTVKPGEVVFEARHVSRKKVLKDAGICVRRGEVVGLAGLMGAGRTELARAIFGADPVESGEFYLNGQQLHIKRPYDAIKRGMLYLTEDRKKDGIFLDMEVGMNIIIGSLPYYASHNVIHEKKARKVVADQIRELRIKTPSDRQIAKFLSGGNQQKVLIARWLCRKADLIIFDEPTRGIDVGARYEIYSLINQIAQSGVGVIMISSDMPEILGMSDRIIVMCEGRVTGEVTRDEADQETILHMASNTHTRKREVM
ncbi:sugar ABC transporter ATP-binding protein [Diplocloster hominis]|uniref:sugar ABC transporter ATP-binding protein n=1 Tax=Diplocloster hominis TaxID=3079010 RepID=UPI0031BB67F0